MESNATKEIIVYILENEQSSPPWKSLFVSLSRRNIAGIELLIKPVNKLDEIVQGPDASISVYLIGSSFFNINVIEEYPIKIINLISKDVFFLQDSSTSLKEKLKYLDSAYFNIFDTGDVLEEMIHKGLGPDYSRDIVFEFSNLARDDSKQNFQELIKCLIR